MFKLLHTVAAYWYRRRMDKHNTMTWQGVRAWWTDYEAYLSHTYQSW